MSPVRFHLGENGTILFIRVFLHLDRGRKAIRQDRQDKEDIALHLIIPFS